jgi:hypothetical protein
MADIDLKWKFGYKECVRGALSVRVSVEVNEAKEGRDSV